GSCSNILRSPCRTLEKYREVELPIITAKSKATGPFWYVVTINTYAVIRRYFSIPIDILKYQISGSGSRPMRSAFHFILVLKNTISYIKQFSIHFVTSRLLPVGRSRGFIPVINLISSPS